VILLGCCWRMVAPCRKHTAATRTTERGL
jgi:hypothetical protein